MLEQFINLVLYLLILVFDNVHIFIIETELAK